MSSQSTIDEIIHYIHWISRGKQNDSPRLVWLTLLVSSALIQSIVFHRWFQSNPTGDSDSPCARVYMTCRLFFREMFRRLGAIVKRLSITNSWKSEKLIILPSSRWTVSSLYVCVDTTCALHNKRADLSAGKPLRTTVALIQTPSHVKPGVIFTHHILHPYIRMQIFTLSHYKQSTLSRLNITAQTS